MRFYLRIANAFLLRSHSNWSAFNWRNQQAISGHTILLVHFQGLCYSRHSFLESGSLLWAQSGFFQRIHDVIAQCIIMDSGFVTNCKLKSKFNWWKNYSFNIHSFNLSSFLISSNDWNWIWIHPKLTDKIKLMYWIKIKLFFGKNEFYSIAYSIEFYSTY